MVAKQLRMAQCTGSEKKAQHATSIADSSLIMMLNRSSFMTNKHPHAETTDSIRQAQKPPHPHDRNPATFLDT